MTTLLIHIAARFIRWFGRHGIYCPLLTDMLLNTIA